MIWVGRLAWCRNREKENSLQPGKKGGRNTAVGLAIAWQQVTVIDW